MEVAVAVADGGGGGVVVEIPTVIN